MGIDVSEHQGSIDFNLISKNDVNFVIIRCGYGYENSKDKKYITNFKGFRNLGIPIGIYWYSYSTSTEESVKEGQ
jgi:GH25 family lysozyme M1 (1,4-beta-N-acetylmuramidase)